MINLTFDPEFRLRFPWTKPSVRIRLRFAINTFLRIPFNLEFKPWKNQHGVGFVINLNLKFVGFGMSFAFDYKE